MSLTGQKDICFNNRFSELIAYRRGAAQLPSPKRWISRHRAAIEATVTITLTMTTPVLVAVATLQPSLTA